MPVPAPTAPWSGASARAAARGQRRGVRGPDVVAGHLHPAAVVEEGVVALADDRDHHVVGDAGVLLERDLARGVVHPAELHGRGQVDRRLERAPLAGGEEPGALPGAVEHRAAGGEGTAVGVVGGDQDGDAGARRTAALGGGGSSRHTVAWPRPTPGTSSTEHVGPGGSVPMTMPRSRGRGTPASCRNGAGCGRMLTHESVWIRASGTRGLVAGDPRARPAARGLGRRRHRRHRGRRPRRHDPRGAAGRGPRAARGHAAARRAAARRARRRARRLPAQRLGALGRRAVRRAGRPGPGRALPLPDPGDDGRPARPSGDRGARRRGPLRLRHDDAGRAGHLAGRPRRRRLRARRPSSWCSTASRWPTR